MLWAIKYVICEIRVVSAEISTVAKLSKPRKLRPEILHGVALAGYVRNLPDKTVELVAQGPLPSINELIAQIQQHFGRHIAHIERQALAGSEQYTSFDIR
ncbi:MAG: hypothetical protein EXS05_14875 [Planctomycetaceae bacterium]|nr:hypothetical protein [Planctomycetaceae bacterium]